MRNKFIAYCLGIICHLTFLAAILSMAYMLATGLTVGIFPVGGEFGRILNLLLLIQFPILHSFFLTPIGSKILVYPFPKEIAWSLVSTCYAILASLQLLMVFLFWTPSTSVWYSPPALLYYPWLACYGLSWILLVKSLSEAGMAMHTGWLGWHAVANDRKPIYPQIPTKGLHAMCRHPIYLSFSLIILSAPVWGLDHFLLSLVWVLYCLIGPKFKEKRILKRAGKQYESIMRVTPYFLPRRLHFAPDIKQTDKP